LDRETITGVSDRLHLRFFCKEGIHVAMAQLFPKSANAHARIVIVGIVVLAYRAGWATWTIYWSPYTTEVDVPLQQPIQFSHKHHVTDDGIEFHAAP
jgi:hypothetical protein